jgi:hypothetical protein
LKPLRRSASRRKPQRSYLLEESQDLLLELGEVEPPLPDIEQDQVRMPSFAA